MQYDKTNAVGDVTSTAKGSGARYNNGKAPLELIPLTVIAASFPPNGCARANAVRAALHYLGKFQTTGEAGNLSHAVSLLRAYWREAAAVFDYGRQKYAAWNWAKGMPWSVPVACAARHALAELEGTDTDEESGKSHVGHLLCNLVMLQVYVDAYPEGNDLPNPLYFVSDFDAS